MSLISEMRNGSRFHKIWLGAQQWSITLEGTLTWWSADDIHQRERKLDHELRLPKWIWRWYCWLRGTHDQYYSECVYCGHPMPYPPKRASR